MDEIAFNNFRAADYIAEAAGTYFNPRCDVCFSRFIDGQLAGGAIFTGYVKESIACHVAGFLPRWVSRDLAWYEFDWAFNHAKVARIFGQVPADNEQALHFNRRFSFQEIARIDGVYPGGVACVVMKLERAECRWLSLPPPKRDRQGRRLLAA